MKRFTAALLALIMLLSLASCGKRNVKVTVPKDKQVAIILTSQTQYPEDGFTAYELSEKYPDNIVIKQLGDSRELQAGDPEIVTAAREAAEDPKIGAIILDRATQFSDRAISEAKKINPDIITIAIEPEREHFEMEGDVDIEFITDWQAYAADIVSAAKQQGAEYFVMFSFPAHINGGLYMNAKSYLESQCEEKGLPFVYAETRDPTYSGGVNAARLSVGETLTALFDSKQIRGENIALFSTDSASQSTLVKLADEKGYIYVAPSFPTPYNGIGEVFTADYPADITDTASYLEALKSSLADSKGRFSAVSYPLARTMLIAAVYSAFDMINSPALANDYYKYIDNATERALDAANDKNFTAENPDNYLKVVRCYKSSIEILK